MVRHFLTICVFCLSISLHAQEQTPASDESNDSTKQEQTIVAEPDTPQSFTLDPMRQKTNPSEESVSEDPTHPEYIENPQEDISIQTEKRSQRNPDDDIQTLSKGQYHNGFFGAVSFKVTEFNDKNIVLSGIRFGWIANRAVAIGFEGYGIIPTAEYPEIDPYYNSRAVGGYGGMFIEPILYSNKLLHVTFPVSGGAGWLGYIYDWEEDYYYDTELIDGDVFWYIEPGAGMEINVSKAFRIHTGATYRITQDLSIVQTDSKAFNGWNYFLTFKFGRF